VTKYQTFSACPSPTFPVEGMLPRRTKPVEFSIVLTEGFSPFSLASLTDVFNAVSAVQGA